MSNDRGKGGGESGVYVKEPAAQGTCWVGMQKQERGRGGGGQGSDEVNSIEVISDNVGLRLGHGVGSAGEVGG